MISLIHENYDKLLLINYTIKLLKCYVEKEIPYFISFWNSNFVFNEARCWKSFLSDSIIISDNVKDLLVQTYNQDEKLVCNHAANVNECCERLKFSMRIWIFSL